MVGSGGMGTRIPVPNVALFLEHVHWLGRKQELEHLKFNLNRFKAYKMFPTLVSPMTKTWVAGALFVVGILIGAGAIYAFISPSSTTSTVTTTLPSGGTQTVTQTAVSTVGGAVSGTYNIGAIMPLTGSISFLGPEAATATQIAVNDYNAWLKSIGSGIQFKLITLDTGSTPQGTLTATQTLVQTDSVKMVIGPHSSSELSAILSYINTNHIVSISLSSSDSLRFNDYAFRPIIISYQASPAIVKLITTSGIKNLIVVHTDDSFGTVESQEVSSGFKNATGGQTYDIPYALGQADYGSVVAQISQTLSTVGVSSTTGIFIAMDQADGQNILGHALSYPNLAQVKWFGDQEGSSVAFLPPDVPLAVAQFRAETNTTGIYPVDLSSPTTVRFYSEYKATTGKIPEAYGPNWYDATLIGLMASYQCITAGNYTGQCLKATVPQVADSYIGATGPKFLDSNGDQLYTFVANWQVVNTATGNATIRFVSVYSPQCSCIGPYEGYYAPGYP